MYKGYEEKKNFFTSCYHTSVSTCVLICLQSRDILKLSYTYCICVEFFCSLNF